MKTLNALILSSLLASSLSHADTIGGEVSLGIFSHSPNGDASYTLANGSAGTSDLEKTLGWSGEEDYTAKAYIEHPFPFIPNLRIALGSLAHEGSNTVSNFNWGEIASYNGQATSSMDLQVTDLTLYYELLDNWVEADAGLTLRNIDGDILVKTEGLVDEQVDFSAWVPMLYAKTRFNFPTTDLSVQLEANAIGYDGNTFFDYEASVRYTFTFGLGLEAGYKGYHLKSDDLTSGLKTDMDFSGVYAAVVWDF